MINLQSKSDCCGCSACYKICPTSAISFVNDKEGFKYPQFDKSKCIECGLCEKVCPFIHTKTYTEQDQSIYAALTKNKENYFKSASGGVFRPLCEQVLKQGGIVYGAAYNDKFEVYHKKVTSLNDISSLQGSKYVQSDIGNTFVDIRSELKSNRLVLFSGTPCQVNGLKNFLIKNYENLITVDLICHGVPSPMVFRDYVSLVSKKGSLCAIEMRGKQESDYRTKFRLKYSDGKTIEETPLTRLWGNLYFGQYISRPSCSKCPYTMFSRSGDITLGDYWGSQKVFDNYPQNKAISIVMINSERGRKIWDMVKDGFDTMKGDKGSASQPSLKYPAKQNPNRNSFWQDYEKSGFGSVAAKYGNYTILLRLRNTIRQLIKKQR